MVTWVLMSRTSNMNDWVKPPWKPSVQLMLSDVIETFVMEQFCTWSGRPRREQNKRRKTFYSIRLYMGSRRVLLLLLSIVPAFFHLFFRKRRINSNFIIYIWKVFHWRSDKGGTCLETVVTIEKWGGRLGSTGLPLLGLKNVTARGWFDIKFRQKLIL